jgi:hypothetical protein
LDSLGVLFKKNRQRIGEKGMARDENLVPSLQIAFTVNEQTGWYLDRMIETGLFGNTRQEAARIALFDHCKLLVGQRKIPDAPSIEGSTARIAGVT